MIVFLSPRINLFSSYDYYFTVLFIVVVVYLFVNRHVYACVYVCVHGARTRACFEYLHTPHTYTHHVALLDVRRQLVEVGSLRTSSGPQGLN